MDPFEFLSDHCKSDKLNFCARQTIGRHSAPKTLKSGMMNAAQRRYRCFDTSGDAVYIPVNAII